ncbi:MAG TPA: low molecular weight protein-tyrosine-phosphatase [Bacillota bacterium]
MTTRVLFVCLGNICRSPLAEGVFKAKISRAGLADAFTVDSAGTGSWHVGHPPDDRSRQIARAHGIELEGVARRIRPDELNDWHYIVVMDESNRRDVLALGADPRRVVKLRDFDPEGPGDVPDPYEGDLGSFEHVYAIIDRSLDGFLTSLQQRVDR